MISVIIPVYNVSSYLDKCVRSVIHQTYKEWECILVDDGSTDDSGLLCDEWVKEDVRVRVIHQENNGVSKARNRGIEEARGEYIVFVDSDDWLGEEHLERLMAAPSADLVVSGVEQVSKDGMVKDFQPVGNRTIVLSKDSIDDIVDLNRKYLLYAPYVKLYVVAILRSNKIFFPVDCSYGEDLQFNLAYLSHVKTISMVENVSYYYRRGTATLSTKVRPNQFFQDYDQWKMLQKFYLKRGLWLRPMQVLLYERLWGIVYDGIFNTKTSKKIILSIPEIEELKDYQHVFQCSKWIKWCIIHRIAFVFR